MAYNKVILHLFILYFIASIIPSLSMFDWLIKSSVAIIIFQLIGINDEIAITISSIMWLLNFAMPTNIGSYFVLKYEKQIIFTKNNKND